jgi:molecular chaperone GrpE
MQNSPASENIDQTMQEEQAQSQAGTEELTAELAAMEDRYKRALADLDNYRKRAARETERRVVDAREAQLREWLEVVDSVERALTMDLESPVSDGLRAVLDQIESVLARQGVQRIGAAGERFDPERHDAVGVRQTNETPDRTVLEVGRSGFALDDRVVRPAEVIVSRAEPGSH